MAAEESLSGQQFFHGTTASFEPGDVVRPSSEVGRDNHPDLKRWRKNHVWVTNSEVGAWRYAGMNDGRASVYQVEPHDDPQPRRKLGDNPPITPGKEFTTSSAKVVRRIDIPPSTYRGVYGGRAEGPNDEVIGDHEVQGTLPGADWPDIKYRSGMSNMEKNWAKYSADEDTQKEQNTRRRQQRAGKKAMPRLPGM